MYQPLPEVICKLARIDKRLLFVAVEVQLIIALALSIVVVANQGNAEGTKAPTELVQPEEQPPATAQTVSVLHSATAVISSTLENIGIGATTIEILRSSGETAPGTHVDLRMSFRDPRTNKNQMITVAQDAVVLAYDTQAQNDGEIGDKLTRDDRVTVAVAARKEDVPKIDAAATIGDMRLVPRAKSPRKGNRAHLNRIDPSW